MHRIILISLILFLPVIFFAQVWHQESDLFQPTFTEHSKAVEAHFENNQTPISPRVYKHYKRWANYVADRQGPDGTEINPAAQTWQELQRYNRLHPELNDQRSRFGYWENLSPSDFSPNEPHHGRLNTIVVHPTNANVIYVGAVMGGLWRSSNGGASWTPLTDGLPTIGVSDIAINPSSPNTIYILTGDGDGRYIPSIGILKSIDGGVTWMTTDLTFDMSQKIYGYNIAMDPNDPNKMLVTTTAGLYRTSDGWNSSNPELSGTSMRDIQYRPGSSDTVYATSWFSSYRSINGGNSWDNLNNNGIGLPTSETFGRVGLAMTPADPDAVYIIYTHDDGDGYEGLYYSDDDGASFSLQSTSPNISGPWAWWDLDIHVDNEAPSHVYVSGIALWKSTDYGVTWTQKANGSGLPSIHADVHRIIERDNVFYTASDGGISKSTDTGNSWTSITDGLNIMQFYDICVDGNRLMGGTQDNGTLLWSVGDTEGDHVIGGDGFECMFHPTNASIMYGSSQNHRYKSTDGGNDWDQITPFGDVGHWTTPWTMHPTDPDVLFSSFRTLYRTDDAGANWIDLDPDPNADTTTIRGMIQSPSDPNTLILCRKDQVLKTTNAMAANPSWTDITGTLPVGSAALIGLAMDNNNPSKIWACFLGYSGGNKVYVSYSGGAQWINYSGTLPNVPVLSILHDGNSNDGIYIGTDIGVFFRNSALSDWIYYSNGLPVTQVRDLIIANNTLYAGTFGRGIWKSSLYSICPTSYILTPTNDPSNPQSTGPQTYEASWSILSTRQIQGGVGTNVLYQAGNFVRLDPGFEVEAQSELEVKIGGCTQ